MNETSFYLNDVRITSKFSPQDQTPDGNLAKAVWKNTERMPVNHAWGSGRMVTEPETHVASYWTANYVYFAFWCKYRELNIYAGENPTNERWELWNRDVVEVFLNPQPQRSKHYYEFEVAPNNQWIDLEIDLGNKPFNDAGWDSRFEHATQVDAKNHLWTCEMRIPLKSLNVSSIQVGTQWRLNFYRADGLGDDSKRTFLGWAPNPSGKPTFHQPETFGLIRFEKAR